MSQQLDSAIPEELQVQRTCPLAMKQNWSPPYPSFSARFDSSQQYLGMLIVDMQGIAEADTPTRFHELSQQFMSAAAETNQVVYRDQAEFVDNAKMLNRIVVCYFNGTQDAVQAANRLSQTWFGNQSIFPKLGFYAEEIWPSIDRLETLYSSDHVQGVANLAKSLSDEVQEHGYWGSARDRLPAAQTDPLEPQTGTKTRRDAVIEIREIHNLCLIRSGQDWTETSGEERRMYLEDVEPVLARGMKFLTDEGSEVGCISNRYVRVLNDDGQAIDQSYGMSWWNSMKDLDDWARAHPTHKNIFGVAMKYLGEHGGSGHLKLTHEVFVIDKAQGHFEYLNCHSGTGVLSAIQ